MTLKSIDSEWQGFAAMVFAKTTASPIQIEETKKAFFAGALTVFSAMKEIGEPHVSEDEAIAFLEARRVEFLEFYRQLLAEYARKN